MKTLILAIALIGSGAEADAPREVRWQERRGAWVPRDIPFRDEGGKPVRLGDYFGRGPVLLTLSYYECPMLCGFVYEGLTKALRDLPLVPGRDFELLSISFDPKDDPPSASRKRLAVLDSYGRPSAPWHFLVGEAPSIRALTNAVGFRYAYEPQTRQYAHPSGFVLLTPEGKISRHFFGVEFPAREIRRAIVEASGGRVGSASERIALYCSRYNPASGKHGPLILRLLRAASAATLVALALLAVKRGRGHG